MLSGNQKGIVTILALGASMLTSPVWIVICLSNTEIYPTAIRYNKNKKRYSLPLIVCGIFDQRLAISSIGYAQLTAFCLCLMADTADAVYSLQHAASFLSLLLTAAYGVCLMAYYLWLTDYSMQLTTYVLRLTILIHSLRLKVKVYSLWLMEYSLRLMPYSLGLLPKLNLQFDVN